MAKALIPHWPSSVQQLGSVMMPMMSTDSQRVSESATAEAPNQVLAGDITYIATSDGWLYLAVLLDLYSRRVVGWATSDRIDTELALAALHAAASTRALKRAGSITRTETAGTAATTTWRRSSSLARDRA
jgi:transposase InsO family protein